MAIIKLQELKEIESVVGFSLMPNEELLILAKTSGSEEKNLLQKLLFFHSSRFIGNVGRALYLDSLFSPKNWTQTAMVLGQIIVLAALIVIIVPLGFEHAEHIRQLGINAQTVKDFPPISGLKFFVLSCGMIFYFYWVINKGYRRETFAITDKRLLYLADRKLKGWINLDKLESVDVHEKGKHKWITLKFSSRPIGIDGNALTDKQEIYLHDVEEPEEVWRAFHEILGSAAHLAQH